MSFAKVVLVFAVLFAISSPAEARHRPHWGHHHSHRFVVHHHKPVVHVARSHRSRESVHEAAHSAGTSGLTSGLAAKAAEIVGGCGSSIISAVRPGAVIAGTNHPSLHRDGRAVDIAGNYACIYNHLHGWPGGYSTDYAAVQHVHISLGGREDGARFVHGGGGHRYAGRHLHYAMARRLRGAYGYRRR